MESRALEQVALTLTDTLVLHKFPVLNSLFPPRASVFLKEEENSCMYFLNLHNAKGKLQ